MYTALWTVMKTQSINVHPNLYLITAEHLVSHPHSAEIVFTESSFHPGEFWCVFDNVLGVISVLWTSTSV